MAKGNVKYIKMPFARARSGFEKRVKGGESKKFLTRVQQPLRLLIFLLGFLLVLHRLVRLNERESLSAVRQIFRVHAGEVDGDVEQSVGDHLLDDARRVDARLVELRLLELGEGRDDDVSDCGDGAADHAPFQWQRQHRVRHEEREENVPDEILALGEPDAVADET